MVLYPYHVLNYCSISSLDIDINLYAGYKHIHAYKEYILIYIHINVFCSDYSDIRLCIYKTRFCDIVYRYCFWIYIRFYTRLYSYPSEILIASSHIHEKHIANSSISNRRYGSCHRWVHWYLLKQKKVRFMVFGHGL